MSNKRQWHANLGPHLTYDGKALRVTVELERDPDRIVWLEMTRAEAESLSQRAAAIIAHFDDRAELERRRAESAR